MVHNFHDVAGVGPAPKFPREEWYEEPEVSRHRPKLHFRPSIPLFSWSLLSGLLLPKPLLPTVYKKYLVVQLGVMGLWELTAGRAKTDGEPRSIRYLAE